MNLLTRRAAVKCAALSALAVPLSGLFPRLRAADAMPDAHQSRIARLKLGVASISLKDLTPAGAAAVLRQLEIPCVSIFRTHAPFEKGTPEECRAAAEAFRAAGVTPVTTSVVALSNDEAAMRRAFDNVRAAGLGMMTCKPTPDSLPLAERFVKEYDIRLAIHNHGPEDKVYPSPYEAFELIKSLDARIGLCIDLGHTRRARVDPVEAVHRCASRMYDVHIKDTLAVPGTLDDIPIEVGRGQMDIKAILAALIDVKYAGAVAFEYERMGVNPVIGLAESVGYVRGMLAAI
jgi:inosose dehydratase